VISVSKTTGPSKKAGHTPFFIHRHAGFSGHDWLKVGFNIFASEPFSFERDFLLPCPNQDLSAVVHKIADFSAVSAWGKALLLELEEPIMSPSGKWLENEGVTYINSPGHLFWREHSERHWLPEWTAGLGIEKSRRDFIGRWGINSHGSNDYVACARMTVLGIQKEVCEAVSQGTDKIDEYDLVDLYRAFLLARGLDEVDAEVCSKNVLMPKVGDLYFGLGQDWPLAYFSREDLDPPKNDEEDAVTALVISSDPGEIQDKKSRSVYEEAPFWVSLTRKRRFRRLHRKGGCWVDPKVDCWDFEKVFTLEGLRVDSKCINCFGRSGVVPDAVPSSERPGPLEEEERSSQESSSSEDELPEAEQEFPDSGTVTPVTLPASSQMPVSGVRMERSAAETLAYDFADL